MSLRIPILSKQQWFRRANERGQMLIVFALIIVPVTFVIGREPGEALVIDVAERRAVRALANAGLVPELRHRAATT